MDTAELFQALGFIFAEMGEGRLVTFSLDREEGSWTARAVYYGEVVRVEESGYDEAIIKLWNHMEKVRG